MTVLDPAPDTTADRRLRVVTWNLWWRFGPWEDRERSIVAVLGDLDPDVVALQEVWDDGTVNQAARLGGALGMEHAYSWQLELDGVRFGNAVLSRWPIAGSEWRLLPDVDDVAERRTVLRADVDGPRGPVQVFSTHLSWRPDHSAVRIEQARAVARFVADSGPRSYPPILCGDLNATPDADEIRLLTGRTVPPEPGLVFVDAWEAAGRGPGTTWDRANPHVALGFLPPRRIDYVLVGWPGPRTGPEGRVLACSVEGTGPTPSGPVPSDHYAVRADLRY